MQRLTGYRDPPKNQLWQSGHDVTNLAHSKLPPTHFGSKINYAFTIYLSVFEYRDTGDFWIKDPPKNHRLSASAFRHLNYTLISCLSLSCVHQDRTQVVWNKLYPQVVWNKLLQSEISFQVIQVSTISCYNCDNSQASTLTTPERPTTLDKIALTVSRLIQSTHERCEQSYCSTYLCSCHFQVWFRVNYKYKMSKCLWLSFNKISYNILKNPNGYPIRS